MHFLQLPAPFRPIPSELISFLRESHSASFFFLSLIFVIYQFRAHSDECVNFAIQKGIDASRSKVVYFKHNDMRDLEKKLEEQAKIDSKNPKKAAKTRRFLIAEGIYMNTGEMCPLRELVELRAKYKLRLFLDETVSFGTIGKHGRGLTEFLCVDKTEVDLISASLENAVESIGGFCVGSHFIVEHQRLSGLGYCFSASQPPLLTQAAISALDIFEKEPKIFAELNDVCEKVDEKFKYFKNLELRGHPLSPIKHLYLKDVDDQEEAERILRQISNEVSENIQYKFKIHKLSLFFK
jgi:serine palmitoyltransferase